MLARPNARLPKSDLGEASVFGEAVLHLVQKGNTVEHVLKVLAEAEPESLADATEYARRIARTLDDK